MLATRAVIPVLLVFLAIPASGQITIQDPADDVEFNQAPMGPAGALYDLREVTISQEGAHLMLEILLEAAPSAHDSAEFVVVFEGNGTWMAGYTALPYTDPAPHYRGGFACPATEDGFVNGSQANDCIGLPDWSLEDTTYTVAVPLEFVQAENGTVITDAWAYSEVSPYLKGTARVDVTERRGEMVVITQEAQETVERESIEQEAHGVSVWVFLVLSLVVVVRRRFQVYGLR